MLTASNNILQEEWVQCWLDKLTPTQKTLVIEVLKNGNQRRTPTQAAVQEANAVVTHGDPKATTSLFPSKP
ncbi:hypothetical protein [Allocoleopsis franciscana]|uniref:Uncharacterized protein n=1 Tax=Allocoleopsis franciscana PCC 7113 TaxID=1173027 RepID=K9WEV4_9CYAN|nr:hypothetical protein [Allocoleopsis franciscana]AFZ18940.1 hypothetical protein Mic7113_3201 [Allocoleopsis franciscana PCC 7113]